MTTDKLLERFADLPSFPGRREPVNRKDPEPEPSTGWDERPTFYMHGGVQTEFFTISHLAAALDRSPVTIRSWESKGLLPRSPYRSPPPQRGSLPGKTTKGRRLWTRRQIDGILSVAKSEGVILNGKPPTAAFADKVRALFQQLLRDEKL